MIAIVSESYEKVMAGKDKLTYEFKSHLNLEIAIFTNTIYKEDLNIDGIILLTKDRHNSKDKVYNEREDDFEGMLTTIKEEIEDYPMLSQFL